MIASASLCIGLFFSCYHIKSRLISRIVDIVAAISTIMTIVLLIVISKELTTYNGVAFREENLHLISIILITNIFFIPVHLVRCCRAILANPSPKNKDWVHSRLLVNFYAAAPYVVFILYLIQIYS